MDEAVSDEGSFERCVYVLDQELNTLRNDLLKSQLNDQSIARSVKQLREKGEITFGPFKKQEGMRVYGEGRLFRKRALVVPRNRRTGVTEIAHRVTHAGIEKTYAYLRDRFYWIGMKKDVEHCCRACVVCLENKRSTKKKEPLKPIILDRPEPTRAIAADIAVLPWGAEGYRYMLIIVDLFSKFVEIVAMRDQTAESVRSGLENWWLYRYGMPDSLLTDQGRNVDGECIREMCEIWDTQEAFIGLSSPG